MPFGLTNAPSVLQAAMHTLLRNLVGKTWLAYLDDNIILSATIEEHCERLDLVLTRLREHNFFCNIDKCHFQMEEIKYLCHLVDARGTKPDPHMVRILRDWSEPDILSSLRNIRSFLGLVTYFRRFTPKYTILAGPLMARIQDGKDDAPWTPQCSQAFRDIKTILINATHLRYPHFKSQIQSVYRCL
jgi:hypothetical protein